MGVFLFLIFHVLLTHLLCTAEEWKMEVSYFSKPFFIFTDVKIFRRIAATVGTLLSIYISAHVQNLSPEFV